MLDVILALISLIIAIGGALVIGFRMLTAFKLPLYLGFGGMLLMLGAACVLVAQRGLPWLATAIGLALPLVAGMAALYPGDPW